jgi:hypothetical protein
MTVELSAPEARRMSLAAQGFVAARPARPAIADVRRMAKNLSALQMDSVSVLARAHYLPAFSRLGPYPMRALDSLAYERHELIETVAHQVSLVPVELEPLLRWRRELTASDPRWIASWERIRRERPGYFEAVEREVAARGPIAFTDLEDQARVDVRPVTKYAESTMMWWTPSDGKRVLHALRTMGRLEIAGRRAFEPLYDLRERVIPEKVLSVPTPSEDAAQRGLLRLASRALGVATAADLAYYFMFKLGETKLRLRELVEQGAILPVRVEGWREPAFVHRDAKAPKAVKARALVSPFDSLMWDRKRVRRMFGFSYTIEIYVPAPKRVHGYYVLSFLMDEALVARVDLKADRKSGALLVPSAFREPGTDGKRVASALGAELKTMASWLGLERVVVGEKGDLARELAKGLR